MSTPLPAANPLDRLTAEQQQQTQALIQALANLLQPTGVDGLQFRFPNAGPPKVTLHQSPNTPSVVLITLPKSGSMFIRNTLQRDLDLEYAEFSGGYFPHDLINEWLTQHFSRGSYVFQSHIDADPLNIYQLARYTPRVVVHVRDPRQATLSWTHHIDKVHADPNLRGRLAVAHPDLPGDYFDRPFEDRLQWQLEHHLPACVAWVRGWCEQADRPDSPLQIMFTTFANIKADPASFFAGLLGHYGIDATRLNQESLHAERREGTDHFRKGKLDEWRSVFSEAQRIQATQMIDPKLAERFDWSLDPAEHTREAIEQQGLAGVA
ncbi:MAG: sulfotransferase domain-containing protein [Planctomycetota bacterium]